MFVVTYVVFVYYDWLWNLRPFRFYLNILKRLEHLEQFFLLIPSVYD